MYIDLRAGTTTDDLHFRRRKTKNWEEVKNENI